MNDNDIVYKFWARSESAIAALGDRYSKYCRVIAVNILGNTEDAEEVLNETYHRVWNAIPPERPDNLRAFIGKIIRNLSLNKLEKGKTQKRGGRLEEILSELEECIADRKNDFDELAESEAIVSALNSFLLEQNKENRRVFVRRYWRAASIDEIAADFGMTAGKVKTILFRMRNNMRSHLEREGIYL